MKPLNMTVPRTRQDAAPGHRPTQSRSGEDFLHHIAKHRRRTLLTALVLVSQLTVVKAQQMEDGRLQVVNVNLVGHGEEAELVSLARQLIGRGEIHAGAQTDEDELVE